MVPTAAPQSLEGAAALAAIVFHQTQSAIKEGAMAWGAAD